ncbi:MAG: c-type cytochrome, partial [Planctomycetota bacterium]
MKHPAQFLGYTLLLGHLLSAQDGGQTPARNEIIAGLRAPAATARVDALLAAESRLAGNSDLVLQGLMRRLCRDSDARVRLQLAKSLGKTGRGRPGLRRYADESLAELLIFSSEAPELRSAAIASIDGGDSALLSRLLSEPRFVETLRGRPELLGDLAASILERRRDESMSELLMATSSEAPGWRRDALLEGTLRALPLGEEEADKLPFRYRPEGLDRMLASDEEVLVRAAERIEAASIFVEGARPLDVVEQALFEQGELLFQRNCVSCHLVTGMGGTLAPPLVDSEWVTSESDDRLLRILNNGLTGPIMVKGKRYEIAGMVGFKAFSDEQLAAVATYVR